MVKKALCVRIEAKEGKEAELEQFLNSGLSIVEKEPGTTAWFAIRFPKSGFGTRQEYGIFDAFPGDPERENHLTGELAKALMSKARELLWTDPKIEKVDVLASKLPI